MKKTFKTIILFKLIALILLANLVVIASAVEAIDDSQISLEERLIGTWRWERDGNWRIIFREDGTLLYGLYGLRSLYDWEIVDGRLFIGGIDWNLRMGDSTITVDQHGGRTYIFIWVSDSTEGVARQPVPIPVRIGSLVIVGAIVLAIQRSRHKKRLTYVPYNGHPGFPPVETRGEQNE